MYTSSDPDQIHLGLAVPGYPFSAPPIGGLDSEAAGELLRIYHGSHSDIIRLIHDGYDADEIASLLGRHKKTIEAGVASALREARRLVDRQGQRRGQQPLDLGDPEPVRPRPPTRAGRPRKGVRV